MSSTPSSCTSGRAAFRYESDVPDHYRSRLPVSDPTVTCLLCLNLCADAPTG